MVLDIKRFPPLFPPNFPNVVAVPLASVSSAFQFRGKKGGQVTHRDGTPVSWKMRVEKGNRSFSEKPRVMWQYFFKKCRLTLLQFLVFHCHRSRVHFFGWIQETHADLDQTPFLKVREKEGSVRVCSGSLHFLTFLTQGLRGPRICFYVVCTLLLVVR